MSQHNFGVLAHPGQHRQQHVALQGLCLINNHERVMQGPPANVGQRQHLQQAARHDFVNNLGSHNRGESVEHGLCPRIHLLFAAARQVTQALPPDRVNGTEHDNLAVLVTFHHRVQPGRQSQSRLTRSGASP